MISTISCYFYTLPLLNKNSYAFYTILNNDLVKICSTYCSLSVMEKKTIIFGSYLHKKTEMHIAFQFAKNYDLQANEKELFKTYAKLTKIYPVSQLNNSILL